jgi:hypothetical protein
VAGLAYADDRVQALAAQRTRRMKCRPLEMSRSRSRNFWRDG